MVGAISVGIGNKAPTAADERMQFEFARVPVGVIAYDFEDEKLVFKGTLDETINGDIYEVALWTDEVNSAAGNQESRIITTFDSASEDWGAAVFSASNTRIGDDSLVQTPPASGTATDTLVGITLDLVDNSSEDTFVLAYNVVANVQTVYVRLRTDSANYYQFQINSPGAGYKFTNLQKGLATAVGTPSWADINEVEIRTTATAAGAASISFDGLRLEDTDTVAPEYGLIARYVPASPIAKAEGSVQDIEYALPVTV